MNFNIRNNELKSTSLDFPQLLSTFLGLFCQSSKIVQPLEGSNWPQNLPMGVIGYGLKVHKHLTTAEGAADQKMSSFSSFGPVLPKLQNCMASRGLQLASRSSYGCDWLWPQSP